MSDVLQKNSRSLAHRLCVASIRRHGNKLYARDRKAATPSCNLANGKLRNGRNRAYSAHGSRPRLFIRNFALIREFMQPTIATPHAGPILPGYPWSLCDRFHRSPFSSSLIYTYVFLLQ